MNEVGVGVEWWRQPLPTTGRPTPSQKPEHQMCDVYNVKKEMASKCKYLLVDALVVKYILDNQYNGWLGRQRVSGSAPQSEIWDLRYVQQGISSLSLMSPLMTDCCGFVLSRLNELKKQQLLEKRLRHQDV